VTVPPAPDVTPESVAEAVTAPPTGILDDDKVAMIAVPVVGLTVRGSQLLGPPLLFESPEYTAFQL
jgi:hypothetical protein